MKKQSFLYALPLSMLLSHLPVTAFAETIADERNANMAKTAKAKDAHSIVPADAVDQAQLEKQVGELGDKMLVSEIKKSASHMDLQELADILMGKNPKVKFAIANPVTGVQLDKARNELLVFTTDSTGKPANFRIKGGFNKLDKTYTENKDKVVAELNRSYSDKCVVSSSRSSVSQDGVNKCLNFTDTITIDENIEWIGQDDRSLSSIKGDTSSALNLSMTPVYTAVLDDKGIPKVDPVTKVPVTEQSFNITGLNIIVRKNVDPEAAKTLNPFVKGAAPSTGITQEVLKVGS